MHGQLRDREQQPPSRDLDRSERRRSGLPLARRGSAVLDSRMPRRLLDGRLGSVELVLSNVRDGCSAADSCHHRSQLGRRRGMPCHHRRSDMRDAYMPRRLLRDSMGCVGDLHFALLVGKRYTLALRK